MSGVAHAMRAFQLPGLVLAAFQLAHPAGAVSIGPSAFGPGAVVESFEGLSPGPGLIYGPNSRPSFDAGYLVPVTPFTFATGATLSDPAPNLSATQTALIGNPAVGFAQFGLSGNGVVGFSAQVPFGTAYLAFENPSQNGGLSSITISFATPVLRVGAYFVTVDRLIDPNDGSVTLVALDALGSSLESVVLTTGTVEEWATSFAGIERSEGIHALRVEGPPTVIDGLTFEAIPEPGTLVLLGTGLALLAARRSNP